MKVLGQKTRRGGGFKLPPPPPPRLFRVNNPFNYLITIKKIFWIKVYKKAENKKGIFVQNKKKLSTIILFSWAA